MRFAPTIGSITAGSIDLLAKHGLTSDLAREAEERAYAERLQSARSSAYCPLDWEFGLI